MKHNRYIFIKTSLFLKRIYSAAIILILSLAVSVTAYAQTEQVPAFPGAEGHGKYTTGGRGGEVYEVTNLNDSGAGSFRYGVEDESNPGPRIIVFRVSGTIKLNTPLSIDRDNLSIFGQTAPGEGIAIRGRVTNLNANNVIIQYIRFRPGDADVLDGSNAAESTDAMFGRELQNIIIDHCSFSWSIDETASFYDNENFTLQWSIISESLNYSKHPKGDHGYGGIWGGAGASFHHNLIAHHRSRTPRFNGARYTTTPSTEIVDFRNNVLYNWGGNNIYGGEQGNHNMVNNYYKAGPSSDDKHRIVDAESSAKYYIEGNYVAGYPDLSADNWLTEGSTFFGIDGVFAAEEGQIRLDEPLEYPAFENPESAEEAYASVLAFAGATLPMRDTVDARIVEETRTGTTNFTGQGGPGLIDSQSMVGGWPELLSSEPPTDSDKDGIPDEWETENGLDPNDPSDGSEITASGYSNLELYIHTIEPNDGVTTPVPGALSLLSPEGEGDVPVNPEFYWTASAYAEAYEMQITDGTGSNPTIVLDTVVTDTLFNYTEELGSLEQNTVYFWRVRGLNDAGSGSWSDYAFFETGTVTSNEYNSGIPADFVLRQNYPNPFNPATTISYGLPQTASVDLRVYDMTGREVARVVSGNQEAGFHTVRFNAESLASGVYIYRLTGKPVHAAGAGSVFTQTKKMTIIK